MNPSTRKATLADLLWLYALKCKGLQSYVIATWGAWIEADQRARFEGTFDPNEFDIFAIDGEECGFIEATRRSDDLFVRNIVVDEKHRNQGIGAHILLDVCTRAKRERLIVRLRVLKVNPARRLYERLGFVLNGEDRHHLAFERHPTVD